MGFRKLHLFFLPTFSFVSEEVEGTLKNVYNITSGAKLEPTAELVFKLA